MTALLFLWSERWSRTQKEWSLSVGPIKKFGTILETVPKSMAGMAPRMAPSQEQCSIRQRCVMHDQKDNRAPHSYEGQKGKKIKASQCGGDFWTSLRKTFDVCFQRFCWFWYTPPVWVWKMGSCSGVSFFFSYVHPCLNAGLAEQKNGLNQGLV